MDTWALHHCSFEFWKEGPMMYRHLVKRITGASKAFGAQSAEVSILI